MTVLVDTPVIIDHVRGRAGGVPCGRVHTAGVSTDATTTSPTQQVLLEFANGVTATLTVSAFTADNTRTIKLMGTRGEIRGRLDSGEIELRTFQPPATKQVGVAIARWARGWRRRAHGRVSTNTFAADARARPVGPR